MLFRVRIACGLLAALFVCSLCASAQRPGVAEKSAGASVTNSAPPARLDELRAAGFEALYNLDYDGARRNFKEIVRLFPDHPAGPQFLAATLWAQTLNESRRLQSSLYNTESFYEQ